MDHFLDRKDVQGGAQRVHGGRELRICVLSYEFTPYIGGETAYTEGLCRTLVEMGNHVKVIASDIAGRADPSSFPDQLEVLYVPTLRHRPFRLESYRAGASRVLRRLGAWTDIVHQTSDYFSPPAGISSPFVLTAHHPFAAERRMVAETFPVLRRMRYSTRRHLAYLEMMQRRAAHSANRVIGVSRFSARMVTESYGIPPQLVDVIPNGIFTEEFEGSAQGRLQTDPEKLTALFVGRLDYNKGIFNLMEAFHEIARERPSGWQLLVAGTGPLESSSRLAVARRDVEEFIKFQGYVQRATLLGLYHSCDLLVLPSLMEGFGIVLAEAMASGRPCVSTKCGGAEDVVIPGRTGLLVPAQNPSALAEAVLALFDDAALRSRMGRRGRQRVVDKFDWPVVASKVLGVYEDLIG